MRPRSAAGFAPLGILARGLLSGAVGTAAMDVLWFARYKRGSGEGRFVEWEFSVGLDDWSKEPAPAQLGKRLFETVSSASSTVVGRR